MKRFRLFAGPNGSGKTSLTEEITKDYDMGYFINVDKIQKQLRAKVIDPFNQFTSGLTFSKCLY